MSLRRITLISSAAVLTVGTVVTPVAIASAHSAPPPHVGMVHAVRPVVTETAPGSFVATLAGVGTFTFKIDPSTRAVTDLVFAPAPGSLLSASTPTSRERGVQVILRSATAPRAAIEVEIEAERGDDPPTISVHREFGVQRDRDSRDGVGDDADGQDSGSASGSNGGPPAVIPAPASITNPTPTPTPTATATTTVVVPSNASPGEPPSVVSPGDASDHDADGDHANGGQVDNDQIDSVQGRNQGDPGNHGGSPSGGEGDHDSVGGSRSGGGGR
jgi:hypothetical protein